MDVTLEIYSYCLAWIAENIVVSGAEQSGGLKEAMRAPEAAGDGHGWFAAIGPQYGWPGLGDALG